MRNPEHPLTPTQTFYISSVTSDASAYRSCRRAPELVGIVAIDTQSHTVRAHCFCDIGGDGSRAATNIEDVYSGAQDSPKRGMVPFTIQTSVSFCRPPVLQA